MTKVCFKNKYTGGTSILATEILINAVEKVRQSPSIVSRQNMERKIVEGIYIIDVESITGIFSIDLSEPVELRAYSDDTMVLDSLKEFIVQKA